ncbi:toll/interleukin-1 receptor domain-containing protein [Streptomyces griseorubiginosus]|uniref:toll/interleukin-1 receptor domain-containing protein n=1 Tax=Streptomyces griseorubiginosus TaxID=67304 RepID=UPI0036627D5F
MFVSYSRDDEDIARALRDRFSDASIPSFIDSSRIKVGDNWRNEIVAAIHQASALVVICTGRSVKSHEVTFEWAYALGLQIPVIPVLYEKSLTLPAGLGGLDLLDFVDPRRRQWDRLISRIQEARAESSATGAHLRRLGISNIFFGRTQLFKKYTVSQILERITPASELMVVGRSLEAWAREFTGVWAVCEKKAVRARFGLVAPSLAAEDWLTPSAYATVDVGPSVEKFRLLPPLSPSSQGSFDLFFLPNSPLLSFTYFEDSVGPCGILEVGAGLSFGQRHSFILRATEGESGGWIESVYHTCDSMLRGRRPEISLLGGLVAD